MSTDKFVSGGGLSTQSPSSETIYNLSSTKNAAESLKRFGINEDTTSLIAVKVGGDPNEALEDMSKTVDGILTSFPKLYQEKGALGATIFISLNKMTGFEGIRQMAHSANNMCIQDAVGLCAASRKLMMRRGATSRHLSYLVAYEAFIFGNTTQRS
ncbi:hypothetical protein BCR41DRAFT_395798 [Lobosporangium transversale]|uniref:EKC/KEOPS complex subunit CGI121 n=1 Tax=Lobosporangium transversale TaxID=64571 RepID=A0A1Y2GPE1_9FUNG|nr:hypothetical protein BCR41DRAFT_395798 [Lobosporangium transversale]ORZ17517.1 hypothetical protein BCR41DRAFT_395798 [Lobosporangium transversale]|eukprot:XP_021881904.1 hypothetical protein BCR41DRAFT_395798 [Lobosporangium transversale]